MQNVLMEIQLTSTMVESFLRNCTYYVLACFLSDDIYLGKLKFGLRLR